MAFLLPPCSHRYTLPSQSRKNYRLAATIAYVRAIPIKAPCLKDYGNHEHEINHTLLYLSETLLTLVFKDHRVCPSLIDTYLLVDFRKACWVL